MVVGEGAKLEEGFGGEEGRGVEVGGVVDGGDIEEVVDWLERRSQLAVNDREQMDIGDTYL